jgi:hypothetical protein
MTELEQLAEIVNAAFDELPSTADEIANFLRDQGVTGWRNDDRLCPLAVWLVQKPVNAKMSTIIRVYRTYVEISLSDGSYTTVHMPQAARDFIHNFDLENAYEFLVRKGME